MAKAKRQPNPLEGSPEAKEAFDKFCRIFLSHNEGFGAKNKHNCERCESAFHEWADLVDETRPEPFEYHIPLERGYDWTSRNEYVPYVLAIDYDPLPNPEESWPE